VGQAVALFLLSIVRPAVEPGESPSDAALGDGLAHDEAELSGRLPDRRAGIFDRILGAPDVQRGHVHDLHGAADPLEDDLDVGLAVVRFAIREPEPRSLRAEAQGAEVARRRERLEADRKAGAISQILRAVRVAADCSCRLAALALRSPRGPGQCTTGVTDAPVASAICAATFPTLIPYSPETNGMARPSSSRKKKVPMGSIAIHARSGIDYFGLDREEVVACDSLLRWAREEIMRRDTSVSGFNLGINIGKDAGQTIFHCHIHLIPRRAGDVANPRGGVRHVIPGRGSY